MAVVSVILGVIVSGIALPFAGLAGVAANKTADTMTDLPQDFEIGALPQRTTILAEDGTVLASVFDQNRTNVSLNQISRLMVKALLAIEDYRFYQHGALDLRGTLRALFANAAEGGVVQGGSTITQQLVKQTLLYNATSEEEAEAATDDTYARKIRELRYAIALENEYSKDQILETYLNTVYFGDSAYGVQAAAKHYFNVNARELDLNQAAILAGLVQSPSAFDPTDNPDRTIERRDVVLDRMAELGVVPQQRADNVKKRGLGLDPQPSSNGCVNSRAPFFCQYALAWLLQDPALGRDKEERERLIYSGGLTIHTTIDLRFQKAADDSVRQRVFAKDRAIGALAMVEPGTGDVRALAQSRPMGRKKNLGQTYLNYTVPRKYGNANGFQAGSTFKAFVLTAAILQDIPLNRSISSPPQVFLPMNQFETCDGPYASTQIWDPKNSTGSGTFNLYTGTRQSVNTFFAQLEMETGICEPYNLAKSMGVQLTPNDKDREMVPSFTLGVADVSPLEMAEAYATFAARGLHCTSRPVSMIEDAGGNVVKEYPSQCTQVIPGPAADAVNDVLRGVLEPGGFGYNAGISLNDRDDAGKTGTTNGSFSVWFVGYTPNLATASMVAGADDNGNWITLDGQVLGGSTTYSAAGSTTAGPIWGDAMQAIAPLLAPESFVAPSAQDVVGVLTPVPFVAGMSVDSAIAALEDAGFNAERGPRVRSRQPSGTAAYTVPGGGSTFGAGDTVLVFESNGRQPRDRGGRGRGGR